MEGAVRDVDADAFVKLKLEKGFAAAAPVFAPPKASVAVDGVDVAAAAAFAFFHLLK